MPLLATLALSMALSSRSAPGIGHASLVRVDVAVIVKKRVTVPPLFIADVIQEAADVWAPYGVTVTQAGPATSPDVTHDVVLTVDFLDRPSAATAGAAWETHLGSIRFSKQGFPSTHIDLYYAGAVRFAAMLGVRDRLMGRIAGRALAHEIGHHLLRTPRHAPEGLMRAVHRAAELASVDRTGFALSPGDLNRLQTIWLEPRSAGTDLAQ